jgi:high-affinity nickel-transport protein
MTKAYGWAFSQPVRKVYYNITVTGLSVAVALLVGTVELLAVLRDRLDLRGGLWNAVATVGGSLNVVGVVIVALFVVTWAGSYAIWKVWRIEERWALQPVCVEEELRRSA